MIDNTALDDLFAGSGAPTFKFEGIGDKVSGVITDLQVRQQTDFDSGEVKFWDDGKPMMEIVVTLATSLRDGDIEDDDGERRIFVRGAMLTAFKQAVRSVKETKPKVGGRITVAHSGLGEAKKKGFNAPKLFTVEYAAPDGMEAVFDDEPVAQSAPAQSAPSQEELLARAKDMDPAELAALIQASTR